MSYLLKRFEARLVLIICLIVIFAGVLLDIDYHFDNDDAREKKHMNVYQYLIATGIILFSTLLCENALIIVLSKVSAPIASLGMINSSLNAGIGDAVGRSLGCIGVGVAASISGTEFIALYLYSFYSVLGVLLIVCTGLLYQKLRTLAYAQRILDSDPIKLQADTDKVMPTRFTPFKPEQRIEGHGGVAEIPNMLLSERIEKKTKLDSPLK